MAGPERGAQVRRTLDAVWRIESPRLIAVLTRASGDLALAEDVAQDAFEAALRQWPRDGVPANPAAWLTTTAKRRAMDVLRRRATQQRKANELALAEYHLLPAVRGGLLGRLGRHDEASAEFARAATLTRDEAECSLLLSRAQQTSAE